MKKLKGFTLVELVIVIIIVGILSIIAIPTYQKYVVSARATEAKALLSSIRKALDLYYVEHGFPYASTWSLGDTVSINTELGIDARNNKYYKSFRFHTSDGYYIS